MMNGPISALFDLGPGNLSDAQLDAIWPKVQARCSFCGAECTCREVSGTNPTFYCCEDFCWPIGERFFRACRTGAEEALTYYGLFKSLLELKGKLFVN